MSSAKILEFLTSQEGKLGLKSPYVGEYLDEVVNIGKSYGLNFVKTLEENRGYRYNGKKKQVALEDHTFPQTIDIDSIFHEISHYIVAMKEHRKLHNFGLGSITDYSNSKVYFDEDTTNDIELYVSVIQFILMVKYNFTIVMSIIGCLPGIRTYKDLDNPKIVQCLDKLLESRIISVSEDGKEIQIQIIDP